MLVAHDGVVATSLEKLLILGPGAITIPRRLVMLLLRRWLRVIVSVRLTVTKTGEFVVSTRRKVVRSLVVVATILRGPTTSVMLRLFMKVRWRHLPIPWHLVCIFPVFAA